MILSPLERGVSFLAIGNELLDGRVIDTNGQFVANHLSSLGLGLVHSLTCRDSNEDIVSALAYLAHRSWIVIISGGLGPTTDDITRNAVASFAGVPLEQSEESRARMEALFKRRKRVLEKTNERQTFFPRGADIISNPTGTAEGFSISVGETLLYSLPGVPREFHPMFETSALPTMREKFPNAPERWSFRVFGLPEALIGSRIEAAAPPSELSVGYRVVFPEIQVVLQSARPGLVRSAGHRLIQSIGSPFVVNDSRDIDLITQVTDLLAERGESIAIAESCTGGLLGSLLTSHGGASTFFIGGVICYSNESKKRDLGVLSETLRLQGAVSIECAKELAKGVRERFGSNVGVSITGIAGPGGGTPAKPVGTFCVGISDCDSTRGYKFFFNSDRDWVRRYASFVALDLVRRSLLGLPAWDYGTQAPFGDS